MPGMQLSAQCMSAVIAILRIPLPLSSPCPAGDQVVLTPSLCSHIWLLLSVLACPSPLARWQFWFSSPLPAPPHKSSNRSPGLQSPLQSVLQAYSPASFQNCRAELLILLPELPESLQELPTVFRVELHSWAAPTRPPVISNLHLNLTSGFPRLFDPTLHNGTTKTVDFSHDGAVPSARNA